MEQRLLPLEKKICMQHETPVRFDFNIEVRVGGFAKKSSICGGEGGLARNRALSKSNFYRSYLQSLLRLLHSTSSLALRQSQWQWPSSEWSSCARTNVTWSQIDAVLSASIWKKKTSMTLTEPTQEDGTERGSMGMGIEFMSLTQTPIMPPNYEPLYLSCSPFNICST